MLHTPKSGFVPLHMLTTANQTSSLCTAKLHRTQYGLHKVSVSKCRLMCSCSGNQKTVIVRVCWGRVVVFGWGGT